MSAMRMLRGVAAICLLEPPKRPRNPGFHRSETGFSMLRATPGVVKLITAAREAAVRAARAAAARDWDGSDPIP